MFLAHTAQAQTSACDQLKGVLSARLDASGAHGYSLEAAPADTPVPRDAKAIGNCEAGKYKILYRRRGASQASSGGTPAADPPSAEPPVVAAPPVRAQASRRDQNERASQTAAAPSPTPAPNPAVQPSVQQAAPPVVQPAVQAAVQPALQPASQAKEAASAVAPPPPEPVNAALDRASKVEDSRAPVRAAEEPAPTQTDSNVATKPALARQVLDFMFENAPWIGALLLVLIGVWIWVWRSRSSAYDEAGLPRGPKL